MNYKPDIQEKILSIFTPVRCLSEQQIQQYAEGNITPFEKHLLQQHLVDCDLCNESLEVFYQKSNQQKFEAIIPGIRQQIRKEFQHVNPVVAPAVKKVRILKKEQLKEKLLFYSWSVLLGATCIGGLAFLIYHSGNSRDNNSQVKNNGVIAGKAALPEIKNNKLIPVVHHQNILFSGHKPAATRLTAGADIPVTPSPENKRASVNDSLSAGQSKAGHVIIVPAVPKKKTKGDSITMKPATTRATVSSRLKNDTDLGEAMPVSTTGTTAAVPQNSRKKITENIQKPVASKQPAGDSEASAAPTDPDEILYASAKNYLAQGNVESALSRFKFLAANADNKYYQQAKFQLALCYKAKGKTNRARKLLKQIIGEGGSMKAQAESELANL